MHFRSLKDLKCYGKTGDNGKKAVTSALVGSPFHSSLDHNELNYLLIDLQQPELQSYTTRREQ